MNITSNYQYYTNLLQISINKNEPSRLPDLSLDDMSITVIVNLFTSPRQNMCSVISALSL